MAEKITIPGLIKKKQLGQKISMLTAYDYPTACMIDEAGIDIMLVGDSLANVVLGYDSTIPVTMDEMIHHAKAVRRGCKKALLVGDMPFMSYHISKKDAVANAGRFIKEAGTEAIKLEGGNKRIQKIVRTLVDSEIPVMGHLGLTPQSLHQMGGYRVQGKTKEAAEKLIEQAHQLQEAGAFALVLEGIPAQLAEELSPQLNIPTIGIGAGNACDGQVLVIHDLLGMLGRKPAKFVKTYANLRKISLDAIKQYKEEVESGEFPSQEYWYNSPT